MSSPHSKILAHLDWPGALERLYQSCNDRYFNGELPRQVKLSWNGRFVKRGGDFSPFRMGAPISKAHIRIALFSQSDPQRTLNTLVHEMVHLWQVCQAQEHGDPMYLDPREKGHGRHFIGKMRELNRDHPELNVSVSIDSLSDINRGATRTDPVSGLWVQTRIRGNTYSTIFYHQDHAPGPPKDDLLADLSDQVGRIGMILGMVKFDTTLSAISAFARLTKQGQLRRSKNFVAHHDDIVRAIISAPETRLLWESRNPNPKQSDFTAVAPPSPTKPRNAPERDRPVCRDAEPAPF